MLIKNPQWFSKRLYVNHRGAVYPTRVQTRGGGGLLLIHSLKCNRYSHNLQGDHQGSCLAISVPKDKYDMREKQTAMILFFQLLNYLKIFTLGKYCNYLLTTMQGDHFANYENIVSQSQTLSLSPLVQAPRCSNIG